MRRCLKTIEATSDASPREKIILLHMISRYGFAADALKIFGDAGSFAEDRKKAEEKWAQVCLYYYHIVMSIMEKGRWFLMYLSILCGKR